MANYILKNNEVILRCNNLAMETFHEYLSKAAEEEGILDEDFILFLERIDQEVYGRGNVYAELKKYLPNEKYQLLLYNLTRKTIDQIKKTGEYSEELIKTFEDFCDKILNNN